jgi:hypothetical protein
MKLAGPQTHFTIALALAASIATAPAIAQQAGPTERVAISSQPGKAVLTRTVEFTAEVVALDKATRTVTLKGPSGNAVDVVVSDAARNFDQIKAGDLVVTKYLEAFTLERRTARAAEGGPVVQGGRVAAKPGERPAGIAARQETVVVDVIAVDPVKSTLTVKAPKGDVLTLDVQNPEQFKVIKVGDQIEVTYTQALAVSVEPAPARK